MDAQPLFELDASFWEQNPTTASTPLPSGWDLSITMEAHLNGRTPAEVSPARPETAYEIEPVSYPTVEAFQETKTLPSRWDLSEYL